MGRYVCSVSMKQASEGKRWLPLRTGLRTCLRRPLVYPTRRESSSSSQTGTTLHLCGPLDSVTCNLSLAMTILPATSLDNSSGLRTLAIWPCAQPGPGSHARSFSLMTTASSPRPAGLSTQPQPEGSKTGQACRTPDSRCVTMLPWLPRQIILPVTEETGQLGAEDKIQIIEPSLGQRAFTLPLTSFNRLSSHLECPHCTCLESTLLCLQRACSSGPFGLGHV